MGADRYFKCYFSKNGSTQTEVVEAWDEREACCEIEKNIPAALLSKPCAVMKVGMSATVENNTQILQDNKHIAIRSFIMGKIFSGAYGYDIIGRYEDGKIFRGAYGYDIIGRYEGGGRSGAAAAAFLLLL